jgi:hypothetical protein
MLLSLVGRMKSSKAGRVIISKNILLDTRFCCPQALKALETTWLGEPGLENALE